MRKSKEVAARTRQHIVTTAAKEFRRKGINGIGLSDIMAKAGLTHGGFYRHFTTKGQLIAEALEEALDAMTQKMDASAKADGMDVMIAKYLSESHRDDPAAGCPLAALGSEIARGDRRARAAGTNGFAKFVDIIAAQIEGLPPELAKARALLALSTMIGALTVARLVNDTRLSVAILKEARKHVRDLVIK